MKDPCMLFYTSDFLTGVALMSMEERGQYITLLCLQQQRGHMTKREMTKAVGKLSDELMSKFISDDEGRFYNKRAEYEINRRSKFCNRQKSNVQTRYNGQNGSTMVSTMVGTTVLPIYETETETEIETRDRDNRGSGGKKGKSDDFDKFWQAYPKKVGKQAALKAFQRVNVPLKTLLTAIERQKCGDQWSKDNGRYIPNPSTWLNQGRWDDEVRPAKSTGGRLDAVFDLMRKEAARVEQDRSDGMYIADGTAVDKL